MLLKKVAANLRRSFSTVFVDMTTASLLWRPDTDGRFTVAKAVKRRAISVSGAVGLLRAVMPLPAGSSAAELTGEVAEEFGSPGRIRTSDQPVNSRLLYH